MGATASGTLTADGYWRIPKATERYRIKIQHGKAC